ncbi:Trk system potassium transporter TrkA [Aureivirga marina]|uniref:Trk system potassium transporter TrkA n=1 Tax=Aureivirga marina TaxID=1182451 RepID=UPI0018CB19FE|nr:Trk system potassium transporter TrkA [Aureivirga marina]
MKIIIAGAGDVGFHLAKLLSYESQDIFVIDYSLEKLNYINSHLDVITTKGDATSIQVLKDIGVDNADILLAVTESQNTNIAIAAIAKKLGAKKTIARISNSEFLNTEDINFKEIGIDSMISPEELAAKEINLLLRQSVFNDTIEFENGALQILGCVLEENSPITNLNVKQVQQKFPSIDFTAIAINRQDETKTIIPRGDTIFKAFDQVYFSTPAEDAKNINQLIGKESIGIKDIMILGGGKIGKKSTRNLCSTNFNIKLIEKNKQKAFELAEELPNALVINADGRNVEILEEEDINDMDAFIAVTGNSETNIMSCLVAKSKGVKRTIALVENMDYINISQTIGINTLINKKLLAASAIFKHVRKGEVVAHASLHNVNAEILEFEVNPNSKVTQNTIKEIGLTKKAVFGGVIRNGKAYMTIGDFKMQEGDKAVVFCLREAISDVEKLFNSK